MEGTATVTPSEQSLSELSNVFRKEKREWRSCWLQDLAVRGLQTVIKGWRVVQVFLKLF